MKLPNKTLERKFIAEGYDCVVGIDEVGMGCLAGPVVVCAIALDKTFFKSTNKKLSNIRDSKLLSENQRDRYARELKETPGLYYSIASCSSIMIDKVNIYQAARLAMRRAITKLDLRDKRRIILVDGKNKINGIDIEQRAIVAGDKKVFSIACASILAKAFRDKLMVRYDKKYPGYDFGKHKGYGTKQHYADILRLGDSPIHRQSFRLK